MDSLGQEALAGASLSEDEDRRQASRFVMLEQSTDLDSDG
jgi:hypothetical protein